MTTVGIPTEAEIEVRLHEYVRPEQKFASIEELRKEVERDIAYGKNWFSQNYKFLK